jgi:hypothetical protein
MASEEQKAAVREQIEQLQALHFARDGPALMPVLQGEPPADSLTWNDLAEGEQQGMLASWVNFEGFSAEAELDVISRVASGQEPGDWFDGVASGQESPDRFDESEIEETYTPAEVAGIFQEWREDYALRAAPEVTPPDAYGPEYDDWREQFESAAAPYFDAMPSEEALGAAPERAAYIPESLSPNPPGWEYAETDHGDDSYTRQLDALANRTPANDNHELER